MSERENVRTVETGDTGDTHDTSDAGETYLAFFLDDEVFALGVASIREVIDAARLTRVPRMPEYMRGVINLRGAVVPVIDLRSKFDMGRVEETIDACIVVCEVSIDGETVVMGGLVDRVTEVFELDGESIEAPPRMGTRFDARFMRGIARREDDFVIVLDIDHVFSINEIDSAMVTASARTSE